MIYKRISATIILVKRKILLSFFVYLFFFTPFAYAANVRIQGKISDKSANPVGMGSIALIDQNGQTVAAAITDGTGRYDVSVPAGKYTITVSGPTGSTIEPVTLKEQVLNSDSQRDFTLATPQPKETATKKASIPYAPIVVVVLIIIVSIGIFIFLKRRKPTLV